MQVMLRVRLELQRRTKRSQSQRNCPKRKRSWLRSKSLISMSMKNRSRLLLWKRMRGSKAATTRTIRCWSRSTNGIHHWRPKWRRIQTRSRRSKMQTSSKLQRRWFQCRRHWIARSWSLTGNRMNTLRPRPFKPFWNLRKDFFIILWRRREVCKDCSINEDVIIMRRWVQALLF